MLHEFLVTNENEILRMTEQKSLILAGVRPSSNQLKKGLPIFYRQLLEVLLKNQAATSVNSDMAAAATRNDEPAMAEASGRPEDAAVAVSAGLHGTELLRLGYTLSHVVHAYGAMCQSITELATAKEVNISAAEFHELNQCLDVAIAGAVTEYQSIRNTQLRIQEVEHLGFLAHELRNALATVKLSFQLIRNGTVGFSGNTGQVLERGLSRMDELIDRSLTEVRLRVDPKLHTERIQLLEIINQIFITAEIQAQAKQQILELDVDPDLVAEADQHLVYSAVSNLIQNALKYSRPGGKIQIRGHLLEENIVIEVEDECGGLSDKAALLFAPL